MVTSPHKSIKQELPALSSYAAAYAADSKSSYAASRKEKIMSRQDFFDALEELNEALRIRKPKEKISPAKSDSVYAAARNVSRGDITTGAILSTMEEDEPIFIDFYYIDDNGDFKEAEVVIDVEELEYEILDMLVSSIYICDNCLTLRVDIIKYLDAVLKNPFISENKKSMLTVYRRAVLDGKVF